MVKIRSLNELQEWVDLYKSKEGCVVPVDQIPNVSEWFYRWFFNTALFDFTVARRAFLLLSEFYKIIKSSSIEEGYGIVMSNLDTWYIRGSFVSREREFLYFKSNLFLRNPGAQR